MTSMNINPDLVTIIQRTEPMEYMMDAKLTCDIAVENRTAKMTMAMEYETVHAIMGLLHVQTDRQFGSQLHETRQAAQGLHDRYLNMVVCKINHQGQLAIDSKKTTIEAFEISPETGRISLTLVSPSIRMNLTYQHNQAKSE